MARVLKELFNKEKSYTRAQTFTRRARFVPKLKNKIKAYIPSIIKPKSFWEKGFLLSSFKSRSITGANMVLAPNNKKAASLKKEIKRNFL